MRGNKHGPMPAATEGGKEGGGKEQNGGYRLLKLSAVAVVGRAG